MLHFPVPQVLTHCEAVGDLEDRSETSTATSMIQVVVATEEPTLLSLETNNSATMHRLGAM